MSATGKTYEVPVEGIGTFTFRKREMLDQVKIQAEASRMTDGPVDDPGLRRFTHALATLLRLTVLAPAGWAPLAIDPLDSEGTEKLWLVHDAMRDAEERFRKGAEAPGA